VKRGEEGFTIVEVVVAILIIGLMMGATVSLLSSGSKSSLANQRQVTALSVAQQQIEQIHQIVHQYGFNAVAVNGSVSSYTPRDSTVPADPANPNDYVQTSSSSFQVMPNYHDATGTPLATEPLLFSTTSGQITPISTSVTAGNTTATVWRYVTQRTETCNAALTGSCTGDSKRVVVAVLLANPSSGTNIGPSTPVYLTEVIDRALPSNAPGGTNGLRIGVHIS
jgi:type II secretory pathway pseudopilin PulG